MLPKGGPEFGMRAWEGHCSCHWEQTQPGGVQSLRAVPEHPERLPCKSLERLGLTEEAKPRVQARGWEEGPWESLDVTSRRQVNTHGSGVGVTHLLTPAGTLSGSSSLGRSPHSHLSGPQFPHL